MAYIIKAYRSAVAKAGKGAFRNLRSDELAATIIKEMMHRTPELGDYPIDGVLVGCANPEGEQGLQIGRMVALQAFGHEVPGVTVNRYCGSGLETIAMASAMIRAGMGDVYIAGGTESMSMIPMTGYKFAPGYQMALNTPDYIVGMGTTAEAVAKKYQISREDSDMFSFLSHQKAAAAQDAGKFDDRIIPVEVTEVFVENGQRKEKKTIVSKDEGVRRDTSLESLAKLRPVFSQKGVVTAGTASQTSDGASFVIVVSDKVVKALGLNPIARLASYAVAGVDPLYMGIGPVYAIPKALTQAGLSLSDIEQIELNEAFAVQSLAVIREAGLNPDVVNVNGGAIALGHPLGCTGAKLTTQLLNEMGLRKQKYGMVTACVGGGQGVSGIFEYLAS
ncbi:MAG TPA: acetyl-CoA C-acyltransferase [Saprospirales bacterium]|nr:acetyl-CoA C-acyltransferase [Saprospirales bacterium]HRQ29567.1 thiolase family protein [Saprospiraceae bacterium]